MTLSTEHPIARLEMQSGHLCSLAELALFLEQYGYEEEANSGLWILKSDSAAAPRCAIRVERDGEVLVIYGNEADHFTNLNYLMSKAGWTKSKVSCDSPDNEVKLLARLVSVDIETGTAAELPASTLRVNAAGAVAPPPANVVTAEPGRVHVQSDQGDYETGRIEELTIRCNSLEERAAELESINASLIAENERLKSRTTMAMASASTEVSTVDGLGLVRAIEGYLTEQLAFATSQSTLIEDLRKLGYEFRLKLVQVGPASFDH
ncbi:hypothetical protein FX016_23010 [Cupriavidus gilardii]|nr:hypothetical protein FX016_23010 [Cupriavidus gilardii]